MVNACLVAGEEICTDKLVTYAIENAVPSFYTIGDGYFGLAPSD